jgi:hypothetical protein
MRTALLTAALLGLVACGPEAPRPAAPDAPRAPATPPPPASPAAPSPALASRLVLVDASGAPALHLSCGDRAGGLVIHAPAFEPIASEERLTLGAGDEAFAFVADLEAPGPGVTGGGVAEADLFVRMARGEPVRAVYGAQTAGPLRAETPAALRAFVAGCGGLPDR